MLHIFKVQACSAVFYPHARKGGLKQFAFASGILKLGSMDLFGNVAAILNAIVSNSYYGMLWGQN